MILLSILAQTEIARTPLFPGIIQSGDHVFPGPTRLRLAILRALGRRNYRLFFSGQSLSLIGTWMTRIATAAVYRLTGSAWMLGLIAFLGQVPAFLRLLCRGLG